MNLMPEAVPHPVPVVKSSGVIELFDTEKLRRSLTLAGATPAMAAVIMDKVTEKLHPAISTKKINQQAFSLLKSMNRKIASRYHLKQAMMELGPTGFPFERFVMELLREMGYQVRHSQKIRGKCVTHEIDVTGTRDHEFVLVECKYHNKRGYTSDIKVPLYTYARFQDVIEGQTDVKAKSQAWIVTNTRFTSDASEYGECTGMNLVGWNTPAKNNLQELVERYGLYPFTSIPSLSRQDKKILLENGVVLARELCRQPALLDLMKHDQKKEQMILAEAEMLSVQPSTRDT